MKVNSDQVAQGLIQLDLNIWRLLNLSGQPASSEPVLHLSTSSGLQPLYKTCLEATSYLNHTVLYAQIRELSFGSGSSRYAQWQNQGSSFCQEM